MGNNQNAKLPENIVDAMLTKCSLQFTQSQRQLLLETVYINNKDMELDDTKSEISVCFFSFSELKKNFQATLWKYALKDSGIEERVENGELQIFAALSADGRAVANGDNVFQEMQNWGALLLDLKAPGDVAPVLWVYRGKVYPWAASAQELKFQIKARP